jgi:hypothetical protein
MTSVPHSLTFLCRFLCFFLLLSLLVLLPRHRTNGFSPLQILSLENGIFRAQPKYRFFCFCRLSPRPFTDNDHSSVCSVTAPFRPIPVYTRSNLPRAVLSACHSFLLISSLHFLWSWRWMQYVPPKHLAVSDLHGFITEYTVPLSCRISLCQVFYSKLRFLSLQHQQVTFVLARNGMSDILATKQEEKNAKDFMLQKEKL